MERFWSAYIFFGEEIGKINLVLIISFLLIALASKDIGNFFRHIGLPLITGFLFTGVLAGPYVLGLLQKSTPGALHFIDSISLAFIALIAGSELHIREFKKNFIVILAVITGVILVVFHFGVFALVNIKPYIPFFADLPQADTLAIAIVAASILLAISPSAGIAVIKELRAKGRFTLTAIGVTILMDTVVIIIFSFNTLIASNLLEGKQFDLSLMKILFAELGLDIISGIILALLLTFILSLSVQRIYKTFFILLTGYCLFQLSNSLQGQHFTAIHLEIFSEPLLICVVAGFVITNFTRFNTELHRIIEETSPYIFILFFTLTGASLKLEVLKDAWFVVVILAIVRLLAMFLGAFLGSIPFMGKEKWVLGFAFISQAGISLSLARQLEVEFPGWGSQLSTLIIAVIVINTLVGPGLLKWSIQWVGEAHTRAEGQSEIGHTALVFGLDHQALALVRQLQAHDWEVRLIDCDPLHIAKSGAEVEHISEINLATLQEICADRVSAIVTLLDDENNFKICELAFENFGTESLVVRINDESNYQKFQDIGARIIDPRTAMVNLLDHTVRSPTATSLLLGQEKNQDVLEVEIRDQTLNGMYLRDIHLPEDTLILSIKRKGQFIISHGYTRLKLGDEVTVVGSPKSLEEVEIRFYAYPMFM
ncbi:monovalent cation:proton antiporter family protein [Candidatus Riflebacteria bacterium]